jgi:hypothetical protein
MGFEYGSEPPITFDSVPEILCFPDIKQFAVFIEILIDSWTGGKLLYY